MRVSHKADYAVRALTAIAAADAREPGRAVSSRQLAALEDLPTSFLTTVLAHLSHAGLVRSRRGREGGWVLHRPSSAITVADVIRVLDGPLASVRDVLPHELPDDGVREPFVSLWIAMRAALRAVLEHVTIADLAHGQLPPAIDAWTHDPDAWTSRGAVSITERTPRSERPQIAVTQVATESLPSEGACLSEPDGSGRVGTLRG